MKIVRFVSGGKIRTGSLVRDGVARVIEGDLFGAYAVTDQHLAIDRLLAPLVPADLLCIGLNYRDHAAESNSEVPPVPMLFIKAGGALNDPGADVTLPAVSRSVDWEAELCVVIGKTAKNVTRERALDHVFGYTCANDVSARDWQKDKALGGGQFARGKSFDGFAPIGPWVVTRDEIPDPNRLSVRCRVNGELMQDGTTADMLYDVPTLIESLSKTLTLRPGAVILTGTPAGVGAGRKPPVFLKPGDEVSVEIERVGTLTNRFVAE